MTTSRLSTPADAQGEKLKNVVASLIFAVILIAFTVESQLTQYVQSSLDFRQPLFIFYAVHCGFMIIFPLHVLYLTTLSPQRYTLSTLKASLTLALNNQFTPTYPTTEHLTAGAKRQLLILIVGLTTAYTIPALLWFAAISLASITDVTAIYNTNAFFAYLFSVHFFHLKWDPIKLFAVCLATLGTLCVVYGGAASPLPDSGNSESLQSSIPTPTPSETLSLRADGDVVPSFPLLGHILTLIASVAYGLYQVLYKRFGALPSDPEDAGGGGYQPISSGERDSEPSRQLTSGLDTEGGGLAAASSSSSSEPKEDEIPSPPPFGLHPNFMTSSIGLATMVLVAPFIILAHWTGVEEFRMPGNWEVAGGIAGVMVSGITFNAGFMILLSLWGPVVVSVGNLLTIVLVFFSDIIFGAGLSVITLWSVIGSVGIMAAFGVLVTAGV